jgi:hypothetical protein
MICAARQTNEKLKNRVNSKSSDAARFRFSSRAGRQKLKEKGKGYRIQMMTPTIPKTTSTRVLGDDSVTRFIS